MMKGAEHVSFMHMHQEKRPEVETNVWNCTNDACTCWMRESFTFYEEPSCPLCQSKMEKEIRILPEIDN